MDGSSKSVMGRYNRASNDRKFARQNMTESSEPHLLAPVGCQRDPKYSHGPSQGTVIKLFLQQCGQGVGEQGELWGQLMDQQAVNILSYSPKSQ